MLSSKTYTKSAPALPPKSHCPELRSTHTGLLNSRIQAALPRPRQVQNTENTFPTFMVDKVSNCTVTLLGTKQAISDCLAEPECNWIQLFYSLQDAFTVGTAVWWHPESIDRKTATEGARGKGCLANNFSSHFYLPTYPAFSLQHAQMNSLSVTT